MPCGESDGVCGQLCRRCVIRGLRSSHAVRNGGIDTRPDPNICVVV